jgi:catechol 2,3-dioxygenase-like lactoylglutathione lyase family enzyme
MVPYDPPSQSLPKEKPPGNQSSRPDLKSTSFEDAKAFYTNVLGMQVIMDLGWAAATAMPAHDRAVGRGTSRPAGAPGAVGRRPSAPR